MKKSSIDGETGRLPVLADDDDDEAVEGQTAFHDLSRQPATSGQRPYLIVVGGQQSVGKIIKLRPEMIIGRAVVGTDIRLAEEGVSRRHAKVTIRPDGTLLIEDLGSSNGIYHEGMRVQSLVMRDGDRIQVGSAAIALLHMDDIDETLAQNLYESATEDPATRLHNRAFFIRALEREFDDSVNDDEALSLALLRVDDFEQLVATHGTAAGDLIMQRVRQAISEAKLVGIVAARYRQDEIAVMLPGTSAQDAMTLVERAKRAIEAEGVSVGLVGTRRGLHEALVPVTLSTGFASRTEDGCASAAELLQAAEHRRQRPSSTHMAAAAPLKV